MKFLEEGKEITKEEVTKLFKEKYDLEEKLQKVENKIQKIHIAQTGK